MQSLEKSSRWISQVVNESKFNKSTELQLQLKYSKKKWHLTQILYLEIMEHMRERLFEKSSKLDFTHSVNEPNFNKNNYSVELHLQGVWGSSIEDTK